MKTSKLLETLNHIVRVYEIDSIKGVLKEIEGFISNLSFELERIDPELLARGCSLTGRSKDTLIDMIDELGDLRDMIDPELSIEKNIEGFKELIKIEEDLDIQEIGRIKKVDD